MTDDKRLAEVVRSYSGEQQGRVPVNPDTWRRHIDPEFVDHACTLMSDDSELTRDTLRDEARKLNLCDKDEVRRLFVAAQMWGSGTTNGRGPGP